MSTTESLAGISTGTWTADTVHSNVGFAVRHMVVSTFRGRFERFAATLTSSGDDVRLEGTVDVDSIEVRDPDLAAHLRAPDFFDAEHHPDMRFASTALRRVGGRVELDGDLTVKGITRPITATGPMTDPHEDPWGAIRLGLTLETVIDRREYGLLWNMPLPRGGFALGNEVKLTVELSFTKD